MLDTNPLLELDGEELEAPMAPPASLDARANDEAGNASSASAEEAAGGGAEAELSGTEFGTTEREDWANGTEGDDFDGIRELPGLSGSSADGDEELGNDFDAPQRSLTEHLREQLVGRSLSRTDRAALWLLIDSLDDDGYLADPLEELAQQLAGDDAEAQEELLDHLKVALALLQSLDPAGVGARTLGECLRAAAARRPGPGRAAGHGHLRAPARTAGKARLAPPGHPHAQQRDRGARGAGADCAPRSQARPPLRARHQHPGGARRAGAAPRAVRAAASNGWSRSTPTCCPSCASTTCTPAAALHQGRHQRLGRWRPAAGGALVHQEHPAALRHHPARQPGHRRPPEAASSRHGELAMRPLVLREIADELGLHESTISPRHHRQVHGHAARHLRAEVLLRLGPVHRDRRRGQQHRGARADPPVHRRRGQEEAAVRQPALAPCWRSRASNARGAPWPSTARA
jgi:RNA polymerase sigma-54 factor